MQGALAIVQEEKRQCLSGQFRFTEWVGPEDADGKVRAALTHAELDGIEVVDVGCGHGLLINLLSRDPLRRGLRLCGIDHDAAKIGAARRTALPGVEFSTASLSAYAGAAFDAVSIFDVLYTVRREIWVDILTGCFRALRPAIRSAQTADTSPASRGRAGAGSRNLRRMQEHRRARRPRCRYRS